MRNLFLSIIAAAALCSAQPFSQGWTSQAGTHLFSVCPSDQSTLTGNSVGCTAVVNQWSGSTWDSSRNRLILWGGGHNDYWGNEVYAFYPFTGQTLPSPATCSNSVSPAMCRLNWHSPPASTAGLACNGTAPNALSDGAANSRHTYAGLQYLPTVDGMFAFGGVPACQGGANNSDTWILGFSGLASSPGPTGGPAVNNWTRKDPVNNGGGTLPSGGFFWAYPPQSVYEPTSQLVYLFDTYTANQVFSYNSATNTYKQLTSGGGTSPALPFASQPVLYPTSQKIYFFGGGNGAQGNSAATSGTPTIMTMSYATGTTWTPTTLTVDSSCNGLASASSPGVAYDSANGLIVGWPNFGNTVYLYNPSGGTINGIAPNTCGTQTFSGGPPDSATSGSTTGTFGRFQYVASQDVFVVVQNAGGNGFVLNLNASPTCTITTASLTGLAIGQPASQTITTTGCSAPSFAASGLPSGIALNSGTGTLSGYASTAGTSSVTINVTDANGNPSLGPTNLVVSNPSLPSTANTLTITNAGSTASNYPAQFGRVFTQGEIPTGQLPQAWIGSTAVPTQVDVKSRWPDSSLKHAVISFMIPTFTASASYTVTLGSGYTVGNTALTQATMLGSGYNFDAQIQLTNGSTKSASARTMLTNSDYTVWASGPIATTIILANHANTFACVGGAPSGAGATTSAYDFGFDSFCAFRPEFEATFWPTTNQVFVRYIGEVANTEQLENVTTSNVTLTIGNTSPTTVYNVTNALTMGALTRWTQTFWLNGTPPAAGINHNLAYLAATKMIPNYDQTKVIPGSQVTSAYATYTGLSGWSGTGNSSGVIFTLGTGSFTPAMNGSYILISGTAYFVSAYSSTQLTLTSSPGTLTGASWRWAGTAGLYDMADYTLNQPATGGRNYPADEIGPFTGTEVMWLYTGDYRAQQMAIRYAELSAAWPIHWREGKAGKFIDRAHSISGLGHWMSVSSRSTYCISCGSTYFNYSNTISADKVTPVGTASYNGWVPDAGHIPSWTPVYMLTGDYFFLEENWAWASWVELEPDGSRTSEYVGRGPTGVEGHMPGNSLYGPLQVRGSGWGLRQRVETESLSPDSSPEQSYYDLLIKDNLAAWEGERGITTGAYNGNTMWTWGNQFAASNFCTAHPGSVGLWCANAIAGVQNGVPSVIPFWVADGGVGGTNLDGYPESTTLQGTLGSTAPWMVQYVIYSLGRAKDLGYPAQALLTWVAPWIIQQVVDPTFNPYLVGSYRQPTVDPTGHYYTTWAAIKATACTGTGDGCSINSSAQTAATFDPPVNHFGGCAYSAFGDGNCSSAYEAGMAIAQVADQTNGGTAWNWINTNAMTNSALNANPKWAIVPRSIADSTFNPFSLTNGLSITNGINHDD